MWGSNIASHVMWVCSSMWVTVFKEDCQFSEVDCILVANVDAE